MRLGEVLHKWRIHQEKNLRSVAKSVGVSAPTLLRVEQGHQPSGDTFIKIFRWLTEEVKEQP